MANFGERLLLKRIDIEGLKSYGEPKTIGGFDNHLTCICGPNGSGKSSVIEAIAFVLQPRVSKKQMEHLQNDTKGKKAVSVTLYFEKQRHGGSPQHLILKKEFQKGQCKTFINGTLESKSGMRAIQMSDAVEWLKEHGGLDIQFPERFIIFQMRTIEVAGKTPEKLLHFLEKIIGTSQVQQEIEIQKGTLSELRSCHTEKEDEITTFQKKRETLNPKVEQFDRYAQEKEIFSASLLEFLKQKIFYTSTRIANSTQRANELTQQQKELTKKLKNQRNKLKAQGGKVQEAEKSMAGYALDEKNASKALQKAKLAESRLLSQKTRLENANRLLQSQVDSFQKNILEAKEQISLHQETLRSLQKKCSTSQPLSPEQEKKIGIFAKKSAASRKGLQTAQNQLVSLQASFSKFCEVFEQQKTSLEERKSGFQEESRKCSAEEARLISLSHSVVSQIQELKGELADSQSHLESAQLAQVQEERKLQSATRAHEQFNQVSVATEAEKAVNFLRSQRKDVCGFLCDLAAVPSQVQLAINQVLFPVLQKVVVVENRMAANAVINYFKQNKIGIVQCEILSELANPPSSRGCCDNLCPLFDKFCFSDPNFSRVFWKFTQGWWLTENSSTAIALSYENRNGCILRRNVVSLDGTVAFSWGSVVKNPKRTNSVSSFLIKGSFSQMSQKEEGGSGAQTSQKRIELERHLTLCQASAISSANNVQKVLITIQKLGHQIEEKEAQSSDLSQKIARETAIQCKCKQKREMTDSDLDDLQCSHEKRKRNLEDEIQCAQLKVNKSRNENDALMQIDFKEAALAQFQIKQQTLETEEKLRKEETFAALAAEPLPSLEAEIVTKRGAIEKLQIEMKVYQSLTEKLKKKRDEAKTLLKEAVCHRDREQEKISSKEDVVKDLRATISSLRKETGRIEDDLQDLQSSLQESTSQYKAEQQSLAGEASPPHSQSSNVHDSSDEEQSFDGDLEEESSPLSFDVDTLEPGLSDELEQWRKKYEKDPKKMIKNLEGISEEMKHKRLRLLALKEEVDLSALTEDCELQEKISSSNKILQNTKQKIHTISSKILSLETTRFNRFLKAITLLNESLSTTYHHLNPFGDCSLHFNPQRELIFDGVWLKVRPDRVWKDFHSLSGGQKALAALALSLAFQRLYPSPLYIFDEVDASLDIVAVERLAKFILRHSMQSHSQFIVVSLRPEFYQLAPVLIGAHFSPSGVSNLIAFRVRNSENEGWEEEKGSFAPGRFLEKEGGRE